MEETKERIEYKIYQIVCNETGEVYFGKTKQTLQERLRNHVKDLSSTSRQIILRGDYKIEQINSTFDEEESVRLERLYIENNECINIKIPGRTVKESKKKWCEEHKEELSEYHKEWWEEHKEEINEKRKQEKYTCECGSTLRKDGKHHHEKTKKHINYMNSKK